ncbi:MAG: tyrosine-type recombinase/integrase, partial [Methylocystis sp.]
EMGLGNFPTLSLSDARDLAHDYRKKRLFGIDPIQERQSARQTELLEGPNAVTFKQCAHDYIEIHKNSWANNKHSAQWSASLTTYAYPHIGDLPIHQLTAADVLKVIEPIWVSKTETASRLRGRIENIIDWAIVRGYRLGENPARWKGHLSHTLPNRSKIRKVSHLAALPYQEIPAFMNELALEKGSAAQALTFAILTAARTNEVLGATWPEINLTTKTWTVPGERMKNSREHRVPLSPQADALIKTLPVKKFETHLFLGARRGKGLSNMAMLTLLRRMNRHTITAHGFRSTFRDWAAEQTSYAREVIEQALAHKLQNKVEAAYFRSDLFEKRRALMQDWAVYCFSAGKNEINSIASTKQ